MYKTVFVLLLVCLTQGLQVEETILAQVYNILINYQLQNSSPFGYSISALIQLTVQSENPSGQLNAISDLLASIRVELVSEQTTAQTNYDNGQATCLNKIQEFTETLAAQQTNLDGYTTEISTLQAEQASKSTEITTLRVSVADAQMQIDTYNAAQFTDFTVYTNQQESFTNAIQACDEAVRLLGVAVTNYHAQPVSFIQVKSAGIMFVQLSQTFEEVKQTIEGSDLENESDTNLFVQPLIDVLMQLSSQTNINLNQVQEIIVLITNLRDRLRASASQNLVSWTTTSQNVQALVANLQGQVDSQTLQQASYEARLNVVASNIAEKQSIKETTQNMVAIETSLLQTTEADCQSERDVYQGLSTQRTSSLEQLDSLMDYFQRQVETTVNALD